MTAKERNILYEIIRKINESTDATASLLSKEEKMLLLLLMIEKTALVICKEKEKNGAVAACATGLEARMRRTARRLSVQLTETEIISLALELRVLDCSLIDGAEKKYGLQETKKRELIRMVYEVTPLPHFRYRKVEKFVSEEE